MRDYSSGDPVSRESLQGFPLEIFKAVHVEMLHTTARQFPADMVRAAGLLCEETGEVMSEALEMERSGPEGMSRSEHVCNRLARMRVEAIQAASVAIKIALRAERQMKSIDERRGV